MTPVTTDAASSPCQSCGACCAHDRTWPRFTTETDADLERLSAALIKADLSGMRCDGERCAALTGRIGTWTACSVYDWRPVVCRDCVPGDDACRMARVAAGFVPLPEPAS